MNDNLPTPAARPHLDSVAVAGRIRYLIDKLHLSQGRFASQVGVDPSNVSKYLSGRLPVSESFVNKIVVSLRVSADWLKWGDGVPFDKAEPLAVVDESSPIEIAERRSSKGVPVYDIDVTAGCHELSRQLTMDRVLGYIDLPGVEPDTLVVKVCGDSMEPAVRDGSFISIRQIRNVTTIFWGRIYVVVTDDYRLVKYLRRNDDPRLVTLRSANPNYDDMELSRSDIRALFIVEAVIHCELLS